MCCRSRRGEWLSRWVGGVLVLCGVEGLRDVYMYIYIYVCIHGMRRGVKKGNTNWSHFCFLERSIIVLESR